MPATGSVASASSGSARKWLDRYNVVVEADHPDTAHIKAREVAFKQHPEAVQVLQYTCKAMPEDTPLTLEPEPVVEEDEELEKLTRPTPTSPVDKQAQKDRSRLGLGRR